MGKPERRREAKLRPEGAGWHPSLPVSMWSSAASIAGLVASAPDQHVETLIKGRTMLEADFEFRGGHRRWFAGWLSHTRTGEFEDSRQREGEHGDNDSM